MGEPARTATTAAGDRRPSREALAANGVKGYEIRSYRRRDLALRDTAMALRKTRAPVVLIAWRGAHTWVMTGYPGRRRPDDLP